MAFVQAPEGHQRKRAQETSRAEEKTKTHNQFLVFVTLTLRHFVTLSRKLNANNCFLIRRSIFKRDLREFPMNLNESADILSLHQLTI
jgi:hypothetical protein